MRQYNYNKLSGKVREVFKTQEEYGKAIGYSATTINYKLNSKVQFTQEDIINSLEVLNIKPTEIHEYFFNFKVE